MSVLDLQGLTPEMEGRKGGDNGNGGGSNVTLLTCGSQSPSNVSLAVCH
jgi:hypothetical protein